jgi:integrase
VDVRARRKDELNASDLLALVEKWRLDPTGKLNLKQKTQASYESILKNNLLPELGNRLVKDINRKDVREFHAKVSKDHKTTANRAVAVLSNLLNFAQAIDWREEGAANPCHEPPKNPERAKDRVLDPAELEALESAVSSLEKAEDLNPAAADLFRFLVLSGLRTGEAMGLKFVDVNLDAGIMRFEDHKTAGKAGTKKLPLNSHLKVIIRRRAATQISPYVFPGWVENKPMVGLAKMWARLLAEAKIQTASPHDLRRTFYTAVVKLTMSFDVADILTGHSLPKIRATYGIAPEESPVVAQASQDAADWIAAAMAGKSVKPGVKVAKDEKGQAGTA